MKKLIFSDNKCIDAAIRGYKKDVAVLLHYLYGEPLRCVAEVAYAEKALDRRSDSFRSNADVRERMYALLKDYNVTMSYGPYRHHIPMMMPTRLLPHQTMLEINESGKLPNTKRMVYVGIQPKHAPLSLAVPTLYNYISYTGKLAGWEMQEVYPPTFTHKKLWIQVKAHHDYVSLDIQGTQDAVETAAIFAMFSTLFSRCTLEDNRVRMKNETEVEHFAWMRGPYLNISAS